MITNKYLVHSLIFLFCFINIPQTSKSQDSITTKVNTPDALQQTDVVIKEKHQSNDKENKSKQKLQTTASSTKATTRPISNTSKMLKAETKKESANNITIEALQTILKSVNQSLIAQIDSSENHLTKLLQAEFESQKKTNESISLWRVLCVTGFLVSFMLNIYIIRMLNKSSSTKNTSANILSLTESISSCLEETKKQLTELHTSFIKFKDSTETAVTLIEQNHTQKLQILQDDILEIKQMLCEKGEPTTTPQPTPEDIIAYNDAIQAFAHINNCIYDLRQHNTLIMPLITCLAQGDTQQDLLSLIDLKTQPEQERIKISLLISKIKQFLTNNKPAIDHYLSFTTDSSYKDCIRCPIGEIFSDEQDENLLGDRMLDGQKVKSVFKLGFYFPDSKEYPYREKSSII